MEQDLISKIADRAVAMYGCRKIDIVMDLCYCIDGGCDLDICKIVDRKGRERFFKCFYPECEIVEVKQVTKMVEQTLWEEV